MPAGFVANSLACISKDPLFKAPSALDLHLQPSSPCIDAGTTLAYAEYDYDSVKRPQGVAYDMGAFEYAGSLPITLMDFKGRVIQTTVALSWTTSSEQNNKLFEIQYSIDGIHFITIGSVNGHGTSNILSYYSFTDERPIIGELNYYRLNQIDQTGDVYFSKIVILRFDAFAIRMIAFPNPVGSNLRVSIPGNASKIVMKIFDVNGRMQWSNSYIDASNLINIDVNRLLPGTYQLVVLEKASGKIETLSFIKE